MSRHLFIVSRHHPGLFTYMREHFADEPGVEIVLDRRRQERRRAEAAVGRERRHQERRLRREVEDTLRVETHAFVTLG